MRVWRVGHASATYKGFPAGPYRISASLTADINERLQGMRDAHCRDGKHPSPGNDPALNGINEFERCGFDTREALNEWFTGYVQTLHDCRFKVWSYDVPDWAARVGKRGQVLFDVHEATELGCEPFALIPEQLSLFGVDA